MLIVLSRKSTVLLFQEYQETSLPSTSTVIYLLLPELFSMGEGYGPVVGGVS